MIWILLAALGIPLCMIVGALIAALRSRRAFKRAAGVFPAQLRILSGEVTGLKDSWPRRPVFARWVHNVLIVHRGLALARTNALGVAGASGALTAGEAGEIHGVGPEPFTLTLVLDSGASLDLAAGADARNTMVGPFVAALLVEGKGSEPPGRSASEQRRGP